ncbi:acVLRF1 family peptidyl-tRNA hydrolase [Motilibacter deserti]|uniref:Actinobacteria/chloroflexi VLRF1 release factor domain-containing protein n=1 Tax=Motilibacter deserti TaxID=2714956 RepID=A0ABX0GVL5_9ACTN|nr:acVLRF1 family peptidyl-tRNA hydrolase [Motilibacter deserti]NHC13323.1 hypothetical protein [Motilibacter deserti]
MSRSRPAAGGGRWVTVGADRLERWLAGFEERHGPASCAVAADEVRFVAADGAIATCEVPFPPLLVEPDGPPDSGGGPDVDGRAALVAHALRPRRVGLLLARLGGYAVGVVEGSDIVSAKAGQRHVQGRTAAGGWSQQRFARRREGQARVAFEATADAAALVLLPEAPRLAGLVTGGDRRAVDAVLADARLAPLRPLVTGPFLDVPDPRRKVLEESVAAVRSVRVRVQDPPDAPTSGGSAAD